MSREEAAREALRMLSGRGEEVYDGQGSIEQKGESSSSSSRSIVGPSYQRQLPPLQRGSSSGGGGGGHSDIRSTSRERYSMARAPLRTASGSSESVATQSPGMRAHDGSESHTPFFADRGASAVQMTTSPTTSPSLIPMRSPRPLESMTNTKMMRRSPFDGMETDMRPSGGDRVLHRPRPQRRGPAVSDARGMGTPGSLDMPSLSSSSTSSGTDQFSAMARQAWLENDRASQPYTPVSETGPMGTDVMSNRGYSAQHAYGSPSASSATPSGSQYTGMASREERRRIEAIRRVAIAYRIAPEDVQQAMEMGQQGRHHDDDEMQDVERSDAARHDPRFARNVADAVYREEAHLAHLDAQRSATIRTERSQSDMTTEVGSIYGGSTFARGSGYSPRHPRGDFNPPRYTQSRTMPPLSPPPAYETLDRPQLPHPGAASPASVPSLWEGVPSARMALESLGGPSTGMSPHGASRTFSPPLRHMQQPMQPYGRPYGPNGTPYQSQQPFDRRDSIPRPLILPDRSYRSMDDYAGNVDAPSSPNFPPSTSQALTPGPGASPLRRSIQSDSMPKQFAHSPLVGSPGELEEGSSSHELRDNMSIASDATKRSAASSAHYDAAQRGPKRRATGGDLLDMVIPRSSSPTPMNGTPETTHRQPRPAPSASKTPRTRNGRGKASTMPIKPAPLKLNHEEVMARLQRKVKERIAARKASGSSSAVGLGSFNGDVTEGNTSLFSTGSIVASPPSSPMTAVSSMAAPSVTAETSSAARRKATPLRVTPKRTMSVDTVPTSSASASPSTHAARAPVVDRSNDTRDIGSTTASTTPREDDATSRLGIEALLSAAAIADSPRAG